MNHLNLCVAEKTVSIFGEDCILKLIRENMSDFLSKESSDYVINISLENSTKEPKIIIKNNIPVEVDDLTPIKSNKKGYSFESDYISLNLNIKKKRCDTILHTNNYIIVTRGAVLFFI